MSTLKKQNGKLTFKQVNVDLNHKNKILKSIIRQHLLEKNSILEKHCSLLM